MRHRHHVTIRNRTNFETNRLGGGYTGCTITGNTKLEDELTPKGGVMLRFWRWRSWCHVVARTSVWTSRRCGAAELEYLYKPNLL